MSRAIVPLLLLPCLLVLGGCNASPPSSSSTTSRARVDIGAAVRPAITKPTATPDPGVLASLGVSAERVAASPVPLLAPRGLDAPVVIVEAEYYAISAKAGDATIAIQGTRPHHRYDDVAPVTGDRALRGGRGFVSVNENIRTASFVENGAAYTVDVECASSTDPKCTSDAFVVGLVEAMVYVGGGAR